MTKRTIKISVTNAEYDILAFESKSRGETVSQYVKTAAFSYANKYPSKGIFAELAKNTRERLET